ncbi:MAG: NAD(+)/NADH kinase [Candidatus Zixiibacteriota bacterium]|nr:MAG: NAD(+)/NADH kinase [candidate division Zixibacteria bacterium]
MKFGLVANLKRAGAREAIDAILRWADKSKNQVVLCDELKAISGNGITFFPREDIASAVDILVSMGGDGTLLASARAVRDTGTPLLGINLGSLGFLTQLTPQQLLPALDAICEGDYQIEQRMVLQADMAGIKEAESPYALNDIVINNGPVSRLIDINLSVNGEDIVTYKADGLVISTPTGSTAYSLAVGGPIMHPKMEAMIAAPISAFALTTRPMIFSPDDTLEVRIVSDDHKGGLALDGQVMLPIKGSAKVVITRADFHIKFIVFPENTFYKVLKSKLHWGHTPTGH